ncbi:MAG: hypothetical protein Q9220_001369 [cf. Caloplaca sp. 1 TL-2023]
MEKPLKSKETSPFEIYQDPIDFYFEQDQLNKPLPPTPRKASSVYSIQREERQRDRQHSRQDDLLPSSVFLAPTAYRSTFRSSTSRLPDPSPIRPKLARDAQTHAASDPILERRRDQTSKASVQKYTTNLQQELSIDSNSTEPPQVHPVQRLKGTKSSGAEEHAGDYTSVLHTRSSALPIAILEPYHINLEGSSSPMSPRITDVVDHSLVPAPLQFASFEESERPSSRFSSSSSEMESHHDGIRYSLKGVAWKAFHFRKSSKGTDDTDWAAFTRFQEKASLTPRRQSRIGSYVSQRRASLQNGLADMYDTLASLTGPSKNSKPPPIATKAPAKPHKPRIRSPAIPLTPYQEIGVKAFETASKSSKRTTKSNKTRSDAASHVSLSSQDKKDQRIRFSTPTYSMPRPEEKEARSRSVVNKLASALQSGTVQVESAVGLNTMRVKRTKSEKRRQELKGKIKVIGLGKQDDTSSQWL